MIDPALRRRIRELEVRAMHLVSSRFMGEWESNMRGQGLEFRDLREYVIGDDVRRLDWKATARCGKPQLRQFTEDRQQHIWFALDLSASMDGRKAAYARQLVTVLGWAAVKQGDPFGLMGFSDTLELHRQPSRGEAQLWATVEAVVQHVPHSRQTDFSPVWEFFLKRLTSRATVIIVSDFAAGLDRKLMNTLAMRHDVLAFQLFDPIETSSGPGGLSLVQDAETDEPVWTDLSIPRTVRQLQQTAIASRQETRTSLHKAGIWYQDFSVDEDFLRPLMDFFHRRREVLGG
jgi:uncharacterized protein (DUF58 family)